MIWINYKYFILFKVNSLLPLWIVPFNRHSLKVFLKSTWSNFSFCYLCSFLKILTLFQCFFCPQRIILETLLSHQTSCFGPLINLSAECDLDSHRHWGSVSLLESWIERGQELRDLTSHWLLLMISLKWEFYPVQ